MFQSKIEEEQSQSDFSNGFFFRPRSELHYDENANTLVRLQFMYFKHKRQLLFSIYISKNNVEVHIHGSHELKQTNTKVPYHYDFIFNSPELNARDLQSIDRLSVCKLFTLSSSPAPLTQFKTELGTKYTWMIEFQVCFNEGPCPFPRGDNNKITKVHSRNLQIFFS